MRVIGVDPGSAVTGFGIVERHGGMISHIAAGVIRTEPRAIYHDKLFTIHQRLCALIDEFAPDAMSLERSFVATNVQSAFRLGEARAMALLAAAAHRLDLFEYAPAHVKLTVAGHGRADKSQVKFMVRRALAIDVAEQLTDDAADALAIALCHLSMARFPTPRPPSRRVAGRRAQARV
jgi:crossover junction endodeoxyribonuclease RuvC